MTEEEWLGCEDPEPMLRFLSGNVSESQLRLTICACYRAWWVHKSLLPPDHLTQLLREAIDLVERSRGALLPDSVRVPLRDEIRDNSSSLALERFHLRCVGISALMTSEPSDVAGSVIGSLRDCRHLAATGATRRRDCAAYEAALGAELPEQAAIVREIFGNPFRPVAFAPEWRTEAALALARHVYDSRDFGAMPILADALQDAGCDRAEILDHCRGDEPHVRGCWAVDLVLGKA